MKKKIIGYMDQIDFVEELGQDPAGTKVYPSIAALEAARSCVASGECGIVEVEVKIAKVEVQFRKVVRQPSNG